MTTIGSTSSVTTTLTASVSDRTDEDEAAKEEAEAAAEATLTPAVPGSSSALYDLFASLPGASEGRSVTDRNAWLGNVTVRSIPLEYQQDDD